MSGQELDADIAFIMSLSVDEMHGALGALAGSSPEAFAKVREDVRQQRERTADRRREESALERGEDER